MSSAAVHVALIGNGRVLLSQATCEQHLRGAHAAALMQRDGQVYLVPLAGPSPGGMLLKQRNAQGDSVLQANDFLAACGLGPFAAERAFELSWVEEAGALRIEGL